MIEDEIARRGGFSRQFLLLVLIAIAVSAMPMLLNWLGVSFGLPSIRKLESDDIRGIIYDDAMLHNNLVGSFTHCLLEWTAFVVAIVTVILAFTHYRLSQEVVITSTNSIFDF